MPAAVTDAYATAAQYKSRVEKTDAADDAELGVQLTAVSRLLDRETERFFTQDAAVVARLYDGGGRTRLYVDDIAAAAGVIVKVDLDDDFLFTGTDETLTEGTHFWLGPANADKGAEPRPYRYLDIVPNNGRLNVWPARPRTVEVTAKFGWPAVPGAIVEATVLIVREIRDLQESGMTLELESVDQALNLSPRAFSIVQRIKRLYGRSGRFS